MYINVGRSLALTLVDELHRGGLRHACIAPGSRSAPLAYAFAEHPGIAVHVAIDERSAAFAALGIAKVSGVPAVVVTTSGTAAANLYPAIVEARMSSTPLIALTADRPSELRDTGSLQTVDQVKMFSGYVNWFAEVASDAPSERAGAYWRSLAARALAEATTIPFGPVHLNVPFREPLTPEPGGEALGGRSDSKPWMKVGQHAGSPDESLVAALAERMETARRGLIVVGGTRVDPSSVAAAAAAFKLPVFAESISGCRQAPFAVSTYEALIRTNEVADDRPDLVVRVGPAGLSKSLDAWTSDAELIVLDPTGRWPDPSRNAALIVRADASLVLDLAAKQVGARGDSSWESGWRELEEAARQALDQAIDAFDHVTEPRTARDLAAFVPDDSILAVSSSMPARDLDWFMRPRAGLDFVFNRGANGIDGFVSTALGAAVESGRLTFALLGDLAMLHDQNGLLLDSEAHPDLTLVVVNNTGGGIFSFLPQAGHPHFERLFATPHRVSFENLASVYGAGYARPETPEDLVQEIKASAGGIRIIEVRTDREDNVRVHEAIWSATRSAISRLRRQPS